MLPAATSGVQPFVPALVWTWPFVALLLAIALLPLIPATRRWWEHNANKLLVSGLLALAALGYYAARGQGVAVHGSSQPTAPSKSSAETPQAAAVDRSAPGAATVAAVLRSAVLDEYVPFMALLFSLYVIAGGVVIAGDIRATPLTNTTILGVGGLAASLVGTTGASMMLIRLLLSTNAERRHVVHTVVFFIFIVSNVGGLLLPIGDPPLFLGYLRGVDFFWTLRLLPQWAIMMISLLAIYYAWDSAAYRRETVASLRADRAHIVPIGISGRLNLLWLAGVVFAVATLDPSKPFPGTSWHAFPYLREGAQLALAALSLLLTPGALRRRNQFNYVAIGEVGAVFIGIFITMQVPIEILHARGAQLGVSEPWQFFWATGALSSVLDNAPTYVVFFETANALTHQPGDGIIRLLDGNFMRDDHLIAISCGAVFMGANTYIGNGPNFMVKSLAEQAGVKMPSFFGYMLYSTAVLLPLYAALTFLFV